VVLAVSTLPFIACLADDVVVRVVPFHHDMRMEEGQGITAAMAFQVKAGRAEIDMAMVVVMIRHAVVSPEVCAG
jgi:hypothetical protein